jgi:hypothetical protein
MLIRLQTGLQVACQVVLAELLILVAPVTLATSMQLAPETRANNILKT